MEEFFNHRVYGIKCSDFRNISNQIYEYPGFYFMIRIITGMGNAHKKIKGLHSEA